MKKIKLLPHEWQTAGWTIAGIGAGMMLWAAYLNRGTGIFFGRDQWVMGHAVWTIAFLIIAFTQEKYEERTNVSAASA